MLKSLLARVVRTTRRTRLTATAVAVGLAVVLWAIVAGHVVALVVFAALGAVLTGVTVRMVRVGRVRKAKIAAVVGRTRWPRLLATTLKPDEEVKYEERMHPIVMFYDKWVMISVLTFISALAASPFLGVMLLLVTAVALVGFVITVTPGAIRWWFTRRCYTNLRVIVATGVLNKHIAAVVLNKIETVSHTAPFISDVLERLGLPGVWHWDFDTQVQKEPFNRLAWSRHPSPVGDILETYVLS